MKRNDQTTRCMVISRAGTTPRAFQYTGISPQIKKAEPAYSRPNADSDLGLGAKSVVIFAFEMLN